MADKAKCRLTQGQAARSKQRAGASNVWQVGMPRRAPYSGECAGDDDISDTVISSQRRNVRLSGSWGAECARQNEVGPYFGEAIDPRSIVVTVIIIIVVVVTIVGVIIAVVVAIIVIVIRIIAVVIITIVIPVVLVFVPDHRCRHRNRRCDHRNGRLTARLSTCCRRHRCLLPVRP